MACTSVASLTLAMSPRACSGAMYAGVPSTSPDWVSTEVWVMLRAKPKSVT